VDYDTPGNFADLFRRHLPTKVNNDESFRIAPANRPPETKLMKAMSFGLIPN